MGLKIVNQEILLPYKCRIMTCQNTLQRTMIINSQYFTFRMLDLEDDFNNNIPEGNEVKPYANHKIIEIPSFAEGEPINTEDPVTLKWIKDHLVERVQRQVKNAIKDKIDLGVRLYEAQENKVQD